MINTIKSKLFICVGVILFINSCAIAGSWAYERLDKYLSNYFFTYADFTYAQKEEIKKVNNDFKQWLSFNQLPQIQILLLEITSLGPSSTNQEIDNIYSTGYETFLSVNNYFNPHLVKFSKSLTKNQIDQIKDHFSEIRLKRNQERREQEEESYERRLLQGWVDGLDRLGVELLDEQETLLRESLADMKDNGLQWDLLQETWTEEFIGILRKNREPDFEKLLNNHLQQLFNLGDSNFKFQIKNNRKLGVVAISQLVRSLNENQRKKLVNKIAVYQKSIKKIIENGNQDPSA